MLRSLMFLAFSSVAWAQTDAGVPAPSPTTPGAPAAPAAPATDHAAQVDALWKKRDEPGVMRQIDETISAGLKAKPEDLELLWRASRARFWAADGAADPRLKKQLGREGWNFGDRAIRADRQRVEGYYYGGIGLGAYSQAIGILKALGEGLESKFNDRIDTAIQMNPDIESGGPLLAKGRYYYELPWPKRDLKKSRQFYEKAIAKHPDNLRAYLYLAETQLKDGDAKTAKTTIEKAFGPAPYDPPEGRRVHELAKKVKAQIEEELR